MKVLFITQGQAKDIKNWSGTVLYMYKMLNDIGYEVKVIDNLKENKFYHGLFRIINKISKKKYMFDREPWVLKKYGKQINLRLKQIDFDFIFSSSSLLIPYIDTQKSIIIYTDACFAGMLNYYPEFSKLSNRSVRNGNYFEKLALNKASLILYASNWAKCTAIKEYKISEDKIKIVNFGVNIEKGVTIEEIRESNGKKIKDKKIKLFFMGVDFERKGGRFAIEIVKAINRFGYHAELIIAGCKPRIQDEDKGIIKVVGYLDKNKNEDLEKIKLLFTNSNFFLLPVKAEAFGIVFAEASSYGLPSISTNTGGIGSVIKDDKNGYCMYKDQAAEDYANKIIDVFTHKQKYLELSLKSYEEYKTRLNWKKSGENIEAFVKKLINGNVE